MNTLELGMKKGEQEEEGKAVIPFGTIDLLATQDGSAAVCRFSIGGVFEQSIIIPRPVVLEFLKIWLQNEKVLQDMQHVVQSVKRTRND